MIFFNSSLSLVALSRSPKKSSAKNILKLWGCHTPHHSLLKPTKKWEILALNTFWWASKIDNSSHSECSIWFSVILCVTYRLMKIKIVSCRILPPIFLMMKLKSAEECCWHVIKMIISHTRTEDDASHHIVIVFSCVFSLSCFFVSELRQNISCEKYFSTAIFSFLQLLTATSTTCQQREFLTTQIYFPALLQLCEELKNS